MKMIRRLLVVMLSILFSSCGIYRQNVVNAPLMQKKGQTQIGGHISFNGLEGQASYAATNHIAVLGNYTDMGNRQRNSYTDRHVFKEIGAGIYKKTITGKIQELFLIFGTGSTSHSASKVDSTGILRSQKVDYSRLVLQADFGNKEDKLEYAFSPRLLAVHYYNIVDNTRNDYTTLSNFHIYAEAAITLRYNFLKYFKLSSQACATLPLIRSSAGYNYYYDFSPFNYSIGLIFTIELLKSKAKPY